MLKSKETEEFEKFLYLDYSGIKKYIFLNIFNNPRDLLEIS